MSQSFARYCIYAVVVAVIALSALGIVMLSSTGAFAQDNRGDAYYFFKRQAAWMLVGIAACALAARTDYAFWKRTWPVWFLASLALLALCFVPPFGMRINGSWRWLNLGFMAFQPSELAKIASVFFLAWWFTEFEKRTRNLLWGFVFPGAAVSTLLALIALEVDLGTTALIGAVMFGVMFVAGTNLFVLCSLAAGGAAAVFFFAMSIGQRANRIMAFLDPESFKLSEGLQQWQALIAFGSGGLTGLGLGEGRQKMLYLPYAHTDFIFPMIGEELGLVFTLLVVFLFLLLFLGGFLVAAQAKDRFGALLAFGLVLTITLQAAVNIAVTTSLMPNKGMPLPFISYGGSNLVACHFMVGVLINIYRQIPPPQPESERRVLSYRPAMRW